MDTLTCHRLFLAEQKKSLVYTTNAIRFEPEEPSAISAFFQVQNNWNEVRRETAPDGRIRKPRGELSKPSKGGYTLRKATGLDAIQYGDIQKYLQVEARALLNINQPFHRQEKQAIETICDKASVRFPILRMYCNDWATKDFLRMYLKNSSARSR